MGIKFTCPACGRALNIKAELGGKRGRCPKCQAKIEIPTESTPWTKSRSGSHAGLKTTTATEAAPIAPETIGAAEQPAAEGTASVALGAAAGPFVAAEEQTIVLPRSPAAAPEAAAALAAPSTADPIAEAPQLQWYVTPPGATSQYGPAGGEEFRGWIREGRVTPDSLVWRQDWPDWRPASAVFPELQASAPPLAPAAAVATAAPVAAPAMPVMPPLAGMPLPTAPAAMPMTGAMPMAQPAFSAPGPMPGMFPAAPLTVPAAGGFPITAEPPAAARGSTPRGRPYRAKSNTGPIVAIVVLLLAMIPLSFFVWKVVSEQIVSPPAAADSTAGSKESEE